MDILGRISTTKEHLRPAEQAVATAILADPDAASAATVASLAREAKVSQASVVRLAHSLGFSGFPDLRVSLTQELTRRTLEREQSGLSHGRLDGDDSPGDLIGKLAFHEARTIEQTGRLIDEVGLVRVADAIAEGRPTLLLGVGASALAASDLNQKLQRIGLVSVFSTDTHMQLSLAALAAPASVVIAFSFSGRTAEVHRGIKGRCWLRSRGILNRPSAVQPTWCSPSVPAKMNSASGHWPAGWRNSRWSISCSSSPRSAEGVTWMRCSPRPATPSAVSACKSLSPGVIPDCRGWSLVLPGADPRSGHRPHAHAR